MKQNFISEQIEKQIGLQEIIQQIPLQTQYGKQLKSEWQYFLSKDIKELRESLKELTLFKNIFEKKVNLFRQIKEILKELKDLKGSYHRAKAGEVLNEIELFEIKIQLMAMEALRILLKKNQEIPLNLISMESLTVLLDPEKQGMKTFYVYELYSERLTSIRREKREIENEIRLENKSQINRIEEEVGIKLKSNHLKGSGIEITVLKEQKEIIKKLMEFDEVILNSEGIRNISFTVRPSESIQTLRKRLEELKLEEEQEEFAIRDFLTQRIGKEADDILKNVGIIAHLDFLMGKFVLAQQIKGVEPKIIDAPYLSIKAGRHLLVEKNLRQKGQEYTPIDIAAKEGVALITGANMGGKTVTLKLMALIMSMAQLGLYVPAEEAIIGPVNYIYFSSGDGQNEEMGLSTFGSEIYQLKQVVERADEGGLILIDELARGTNPIEGYGISRGVIEFLKEKNSLTMITTHFDGLSEIEGIRHLQVIGLRNASIELLKQELENNANSSKHTAPSGILEKYMDYRIEEIKKIVQEEDLDDKMHMDKVPKDAIMIAEIMGLNKEIIKYAKEAIF